MLWEVGSNGSSCIQQETTGNFQNDKHRSLIPLLHTDCVNYAKQKEAHHGAEQICAAVYYCNCCYTDDWGNGNNRKAYD